MEDRYNDFVVRLRLTQKSKRASRKTAGGPKDSSNNQPFSRASVIVVRSQTSEGP